MKKKDTLRKNKENGKQWNKKDRNEILVEFNLKKKSKY